MGTILPALLLPASCRVLLRGSCGTALQDFSCPCFPLPLLNTQNNSFTTNIDLRGGSGSCVAGVDSSCVVGVDSSNVAIWTAHIHGLSVASVNVFPGREGLSFFKDCPR